MTALACTSPHFQKAALRALRPLLRAVFLLPRLLPALLLSLSFAASAQTYTIGVEDLDYLPLASGSQGHYSGYARELLDAFAQDSGYAFDYVILPINRLNAIYFGPSKALDFRFPDDPHWAPEMRAGKAVSYSDPAIHATEGLMVLPQNLGKGLGSIKTIGTILGFTPSPFAEQIRNGSIQIATNPNSESLVRQALLGRVDAIYINIEVGYHLLDANINKRGQLAFDPSLPHKPTPFSLSSITHPDAIAQFNAFLAKHEALQSQLMLKYGMTTSYKP